MFEAYFFDKRATTNYRVFRLLKALQEDVFTINRLAQDSGLSYSQTYNAFQDIMVELQMMSNHPVADVNETDFKAVGGSVSVDSYRFHLLNDTLAFRFFDYLFTAPTPDVHVFCTEHGLSIPTLRRRIAPFKTYLVSFGLRLNALTWALEGPELQIRMLMLTFYQLAYRGVGWPFSVARFRQAKGNLDLINRLDPAWFQPEQLYTKQDLLILAVQQLRIENGHALTPDSRWTALVAATQLPLQPLIYTRNRFPSLTPRKCLAERDYYYFCRIHYLSFGQRVTATQSLVMRAFDQPTLIINQFADGLLDTLIAASDPTATESLRSAHTVLRVNLHRMAVSYYVLHGHFAKRIDFLDRRPQDAESGRLPELIHQFFQTMAPTGPLAPFAGHWAHMHRELYRVIAPDFPVLDADHQLKVAVFVDGGTFVARDLHQFLAGLHFVRRLPNDPNQVPDMIISALSDATLITDFYAGHDLSRTPIIPWATDADDNDFFRLMTILRRARLGSTDTLELW
ncbi:helix-turn-helix domain-containing protein [Lacticaseibacillus daqingensis]|uniref:helix-turn-helix domain-containing protein n=1 Tax=Lacticaseibacillus daqingensis TaxID=2486014 RepID=UPI000F7B9535|nr:helix-turn-helix domain-containing protein [Lacticaseibacillus daqingensis]